MRARGFNKVVEIWNIGIVADGFGGNTVQESLLSKSWAKIESVDAKSSSLSTEFGMLDASKSLIITVRKRNDLIYDLQTMFIKYRDEKYVIKSHPTNENFEDSFIRFICTKMSENVTGNDLNTYLNT